RSGASVENILLSIACVIPKMNEVTFFAEICRIFFESVGIQLKLVGRRHKLIFWPRVAAPASAATPGQRLALAIATSSWQRRQEKFFDNQVAIRVAIHKQLNTSMVTFDVCMSPKLD